MSTTREALAELEQAAAHYRLTFQIAPSADHLDVGRAWDRMRKAGDKARATLAQSDAQPVAWRAKSVHGWVYDEKPGGMGLVWRPLVEPSIGGRCASGDSTSAKPEPQRFPSPSEQPRAAGLNQCGASPQEAQPTTYHTEQSLMDIVVAQEASLQKRAAQFIQAEPDEDAVHGRCAFWLRNFIFKHKREPYPQEVWDAAQPTRERLSMQPLSNAEVDAILHRRMSDICLPEGNAVRKLNAYRALVRDGADLAIESIVRGEGAV